MYECVCKFVLFISSYLVVFISATARLTYFLWFAEEENEPVILPSDAFQCAAGEVNFL